MAHGIYILPEETRVRVSHLCMGLRSSDVLCPFSLAFLLSAMDPVRCVEESSARPRAQGRLFFWHVKMDPSLSEIDERHRFKMPFWDLSDLVFVYLVAFSADCHGLRFRGCFDLSSPDMRIYLLWLFYALSSLDSYLDCGSETS